MAIRKNNAFNGDAIADFVYLDHAASTPMRQEAIEAMTPYMSGIYANPSGAHRFSRIARKAIDEARDDVAEVLGCKVGEVVFTSGGTEGDNEHDLTNFATKHFGDIIAVYIVSKT